MAIRLRTYGGSSAVISLSYNRGRQDDGRLTVESLGGAPANIPAGWGNGMSLLSIITGKTAEGTVTTAEYIGNSYKLDVGNIVLFKRGIEGNDCPHAATKTVVIPTASFSFNGSGSGTFTFGSESRDITVLRRKSCSDTGPILGEEDWASNPCEPSSASYDCGKALAYISRQVSGLSFGGSASGRCSFEGSYRSVLTSIAGQVGGIGWSFNSGGGCGSPPQDGCNVYSSKTGKTLEGAYSAATWLYQRVTGMTRTGRATVTVYETAETSPVKHPDYPTDDDFRDEMLPAYRKWQALNAAQRFDTRYMLEEFGISNMANYDGFFAKDWSAVLALNIVNIWDFIKTFGIEYELLVNLGSGAVVSGIINITLGWGALNPHWIALIASGFKRRFRQECFAQMGADQDLDQYIRIYTGWPVEDVKQRRQPNAELFYPAPALNNKTFDISSTDTVFRSKSTNVTVSPSPESREVSAKTGFPLNDNDNDNNNGDKNRSGTIVKTGVWRSVQATINEGSYGIGNNKSEGPDDSAWDASYAGAYKEVNPEILRYLVDGAENFHARRGNFFNNLAAGMKVYAVGRTPGNIQVMCGGRGLGGNIMNGGSINTNDLSSIAGRLDEDQIVPAEAGGDGEPLVEEEAEQWDDPCEDVVQIATDDADTTGVPLVYGNQDEAHGITSASGETCKAMVSLDNISLRPNPFGDAQFTYVLPSLAPMKWVIKTEYQFSASVRGVVDATNIWTKSGGSAANGLVLSHSLNVVEIPSPTSGPQQDVLVPSAGAADGYVPVTEVTLDGFFYPSCADLESVSATLNGTDGLTVTYRTQGVRPQFGQKLISILPKVTEATIRT